MREIDSLPGVEMDRRRRARRRAGARQSLRQAIETSIAKGQRRDDGCPRDGKLQMDRAFAGQNRGRIAGSRRVQHDAKTSPRILRAAGSARITPGQASWPWRAMPAESEMRPAARSLSSILNSAAQSPRTVNRRDRRPGMRGLACSGSRSGSSATPGHARKASAHPCCRRSGPAHHAGAPSRFAGQAARVPAARNLAREPGRDRQGAPSRACPRPRSR